MDAPEQQIRRPKRKGVEKSHYSDKVGRHTAKTQYAVNVHGAIIRNSRHFPGRAHGIKVYKTMHPTFPQEPAAPKRIGQGRGACRVVVLYR